jgi:pSer/pThr/pTyr-binding forkhead associated (FHA) protein
MLITGGTIGRLGNHEVLLDEEDCCSKSHAKIIFQEDKYFICDIGSVNGTFVNSKRLSKSKVASS